MRRLRRAEDPAPRRIEKVPVSDSSVFGLGGGHRCQAGDPGVLGDFVRLDRRGVRCRAQEGGARTACERQERGMPWIFPRRPTASLFQNDSEVQLRSRVVPLGSSAPNYSALTWMLPPTSGPPFMYI